MSEKKKVKILFDWNFGPIWKGEYCPETNEWKTGVGIIDNDKALNVLNDEASDIYSSLYYEKNGRVEFDYQKFDQVKGELYSLVQTIILRLNQLNDGSFVIDDQATPMLCKKAS